MTTQLENEQPVTSEPQQPKTNSYDSTPPPALLDFMMKRWKPGAKKLPPKLKHSDAFRARRRALSKLFPGETLKASVWKEGDGFVATVTAPERDDAVALAGVELIPA